MKLQEEIFPPFSIAYLGRRGLRRTEDQAQVRGSGSCRISSIDIHAAPAGVLFQPVPLTGTKPAPVQTAPAPVALHVSLQGRPKPRVSGRLRLPPPRPFPARPQLAAPTRDRRPPLYTGRGRARRAPQLRWAGRSLGTGPRWAGGSRRAMGRTKQTARLRLGTTPGRASSVPQLRLAAEPSGPRPAPQAPVPFSPSAPGCRRGVRPGPPAHGPAPPPHQAPEAPASPGAPAPARPPPSPAGRRDPGQRRRRPRLRTGPAPEARRLPPPEGPPGSGAAGRGCAVRAALSAAGERSKSSTRYSKTITPFPSLTSAAAVTASSVRAPPSSRRWAAPARYRGRPQLRVC